MCVSKFWSNRNPVWICHFCLIWRGCNAIENYTLNVPRNLKRGDLFFQLAFHKFASVILTYLQQKLVFNWTKILLTFGFTYEFHVINTLFCFYLRNYQHVKKMEMSLVGHLIKTNFEGLLKKKSSRTNQVHFPVNCLTLEVITCIYV